jgi:serine/threonine protein phosphatase PrpC
MRWEQQVRYAVRSDVGFRRQMNQDTAAVEVCTDEATWRRRGHLLLVADGMGGHAAGELASKIAAETLPHTFYKSSDEEITLALRSAIEAANEAIHERGSASRDFERMGTTCSALVLSLEGAVLGHVGDSRVYRVRDGYIHQLTFDHSLQWELLRKGEMKPEDIFLHEPRHVITRSLGPEPVVKVDVEGPYPVWGGDRYVICSDGLTGHVEDSEIGMIVAELPPTDASRLLVNLANLRGGSDNITVVVVEVGDVPAGLEENRAVEEPVEEGITGLELAGFWAASIMFMVGTVYLLFRRWVPGAIWATMAALSVGAIIAWIRWRQPKREEHPEFAETTLWRPYRAAKASFSRKLLNQLVAIESELHRTAIDEGWTLDEAKLDTALAAAKESLARQDHSVVLREIAIALDVLMKAVQQHRKQLKHEARWGRDSDTPSKPPEK